MVSRQHEITVPFFHYSIIPFFHYSNIPLFRYPIIPHPTIRPITMTSQSLIQEFLRQKQFAFIGVSRNDKDFSRMLFRAFVDAGYQALPVNPGAMEIEGRKCFGSILDVTPRVTSALLMLPKQSLTRVIVKCAEAGVTLLWIYGITGPREIPAEVLAICKEHGIEVIPGYCPLMFLRDAGWFHRLHGGIMKLVGLYPR